MTQVDTAQTGQGGADRRETGSHAWSAPIRRAIRRGSRPEPWKRSPVLAGLAVLLGLLMLLHAEIPNRAGNLGSLVETFLPWFGVPSSNVEPAIVQIIVARRGNPKRTDGLSGHDHGG